MRTLLIMTFIAATAVSFPADADCRKSTVQLLAYVTPLAASDFADARGGVRSKTQFGEQYALSAPAEAFCADGFILEHSLADGNGAENWAVKFDDNHSGRPDAVGLWAIKAFAPVLKRHGFPEKPDVYEASDSPGQYILVWPGPSDTWVRLETFFDPSDKRGFTSYEVRVGHNVK